MQTEVIYAALIGAVIGSLLSVFFKHELDKRSEALRTRKNIVRQYLFQLQDSCELLWYRLKNIEFDKGLSVMDQSYYVTSTLYALGRTLACERILSLDGIYPELAELYDNLDEKLNRASINRALNHMHFHQYDRFALAEAVMEYDAGRHRPITYLEFRSRFESTGSPEKKWLEPSCNAVNNLNQSKLQELLLVLQDQVTILSRVTGSRSRIAEAPLALAAKS